MNQDGARSRHCRRFPGQRRRAYALTIQGRGGSLLAMPDATHYREMPIRECGEPLRALPEAIGRRTPHPYAQLGAPYGDASPFLLRRGVVERLSLAENHIQRVAPGLRLVVFDAYRPVAVQRFMVGWTFQQQLERAGLSVQSLTEAERQAVLAQVYQFWAPPSLDPATPPPHSTGGAVDLTLADAEGNELDMGSAIDEIGARSYPEHFAAADTEPERTFHARRTLLYDAMASAGFRRHPREWWHFSWGDQLWALLAGEPAAHYGRADLCR